MSRPQALACEDVEIQAVRALARSKFAYCCDPTNPAFMENAGGSQVPTCVPLAMAHYMTHNYVQLGAGYGASNRATATVENAHLFMRTWLGARDGSGEVVMGPSTSQLLFHLGDCFSRILGPGDEVVVQQACHEANTGPWVRCTGRSGAKLLVWEVDPSDCSSDFGMLRLLLSAATKVVAVTHASNLLGEILDLMKLMALVQEVAPNAKVIVDGVAYAPHRAINVDAWGVDAYVFSTYKAYGPHLSAMFVSRSIISQLGEKGQGNNHYFVPYQDFVYKFELGSVAHECCAGVLAIQEYLAALVAGPCSVKKVSSYAERGPEVYMSRETLERAFCIMTSLEAPLQAALGAFLGQHPKIRLLGPSSTDVGDRVPTFSFYHRERSSSSISKDLQEAGFSVRHGHMYAKRLLEKLMLPNGTDEGVVRISLLHYNTPQEVDNLIEFLKRVLA